MEKVTTTNAANRIEGKEEEDWSGLEFEAREYLIRYYTCARPECRYRTELLEEARKHELTHRGHYYEEEYVIKSRIRRLPS